MLFTAPLKTIIGTGAEDDLKEAIAKKIEEHQKCQIMYCLKI